VIKLTITNGVWCESRLTRERYYVNKGSATVIECPRGIEDNLPGFCKLSNGVVRVEKIKKLKEWVSRK
jgi:hypothetical protein